MVTINATIIDRGYRFHQRVDMHVVIYDIRESRVDYGVRVQCGISVEDFFL